MQTDRYSAAVKVGTRLVVLSWAAWLFALAYYLLTRPARGRNGITHGSY